MNRMIRFSPRSDLQNVQREIDRVFDSFFRPSSTEGKESAVWSPRVDLSETEDAYLIHLDVPGMKKEDIEINFQDGTLTISGERRSHEAQEDEQRNYMRVERSFGHFYRSFTLPNTVNADDIQADYQEGVLKVRVPKAEEIKPRRIEIA